MKKIKQVKLAQGIRGETSNVLNDTKYNLEFDGQILRVSHKAKSAFGPFIIFPTNIQYIEEGESEQSIANESKKAKK